MRNALFLAAAAAAASMCAAAVPAGFTEDFAAAKERAAKEDKPMFVLFTGSDWCPWCVRLEKEVLSQKEFAEAAGAFVPVYLDFPSDESKQSPALRAANRALAGKYGVRGFPTVLILDAKGEVAAKTGYRKGGAAKYAEHLRGILKESGFAKSGGSGPAAGEKAAK